MCVVIWLRMNHLYIKPMTSQISPECVTCLLLKNSCQCHLVIPSDNNSTKMVSSWCSLSTLIEVFRQHIRGQKNNFHACYGQIRFQHQPLFCTTQTSISPLFGLFFFFFNRAEIASKTGIIWMDCIRKINHKLHMRPQVSCWLHKDARKPWLCRHAF